MNDAAVEAERIIESLFKQPDGTFRSYTITRKDGSQATVTYEMMKNVVAKLIFNMTNQ